MKFNSTHISAGQVRPDKNRQPVRRRRTPPPNSWSDLATRLLREPYRPGVPINIAKNIHPSALLDFYLNSSRKKMHFQFHSASRSCAELRPEKRGLRNAGRGDMPRSSAGSHIVPPTVC